MVCLGLLDFVGQEVERDASIMQQVRDQRGTRPSPERQEGKCVAVACVSCCAHPVSLAHFTCALSLLVIVFNILFSLGAMTRPAARDTFLRLSCAMNIELLADPPNVGFNTVTTMFPWRTRWLIL